MKSVAKGDSMAKSRSLSFYTTVNIISGLGVLFVNSCISFFLSPYIIRTIGVEANGFVNLANNFVAYADLAVTALNAMAARFITLAYAKGDYKRANLYYNSVFWGNLFIVGVLLVPAALFITRLEQIVDIPSPILLDVKLLFSIIFLSFFLRTGLPNWDCGTYVTNRMDRSNVPSILTALLRCIILICMFSLFTPHVWYVGLATTTAAGVYLLVQWYNTHTLTPELYISLKKPICSGKVIGQLVGAGIWSSLAIAGNTLMSGLDLLICNKYLGATLMGVLSVSKSMPNILTTFSETIRGAFGPELTLTYAKGDKEELKRCVQRSLKISSAIVTVPVAGLIVMSGDLYRLWVPSQDAELLQILTVLAILRYVFSSGAAVLNNAFTTMNKVKYNSAALILTGVISIGLTLALIQFTDLDLYAVAGMSSIVMIGKDLCFMIPAASRFLGFKWYQFYPQVGISIVSCGLITAIGVAVRAVLPVNTWGTFIAACAIIGILGLAVNVMIVLKRSERRYLFDLIKRKIGKNSNTQ